MLTNSLWAHTSQLYLPRTCACESGGFGPCFGLGVKCQPCWRGLPGFSCPSHLAHTNKPLRAPQPRSVDRAGLQGQPEVKQWAGECAAVPLGNTFPWQWLPQDQSPNIFSPLLRMLVFPVTSACRIDSHISDLGRLWSNPYLSTAHRWTGLVLTEGPGFSFRPHCSWPQSQHPGRRSFRVQTALRAILVLRRVSQVCVPEKWFVVQAHLKTAFSRKPYVTSSALFEIPTVFIVCPVPVTSVAVYPLKYRPWSCNLDCKVHEGKDCTMTSFHPQELEQAPDSARPQTAPTINCHLPTWSSLSHCLSCSHSVKWLRGFLLSG